MLASLLQKARDLAVAAHHGVGPCAELAGGPALILPRPAASPCCLALLCPHPAAFALAAPPRTAATRRRTRVEESRPRLPCTWATTPRRPPRARRARAERAPGQRVPPRPVAGAPWPAAPRLRTRGQKPRRRGRRLGSARADGKLGRREWGLRAAPRRSARGIHAASKSSESCRMPRGIAGRPRPPPVRQ